MGHESEEPVAERRRSRTGWIVGAVVVVTALAVGSGIAYAATRRTAEPGHAAQPASPSANAPAHLDERAACQVLAPAIQDGITAMKDIAQHPDGTTVDRTALTATIAVLNRIYASGPPDLSTPVTDMRNRLLALQSALNGEGNRTIDTLGFSFAAQNVLDRCRPYA
jgi:hypothetical protein